MTRLRPRQYKWRWWTRHDGNVGCFHGRRWFFAARAAHIRFQNDFSCLLIVIRGLFRSRTGMA